MAVATPTIFPVPTVADKAVQRALKLSISPWPTFFALKIKRKAKGSFTICNNFKRMVSQIPVPTSKISKGGPQTKLLI